VYAVQLVVPDVREEEHHFTTFAAAAQDFDKRCQAQEFGLVLLWAFDPTSREWAFQRGIWHLFTGKPGFYELQDRPDVSPPMSPLALEELMERKIDGTHHHGPDA
jgi:hypothetical protein